MRLSAPPHPVDTSSGKVDPYLRSYTAPAPPSLTGRTSALPGSAAFDSNSTPRSGSSPTLNSPRTFPAQLQYLAGEPEHGASTPNPSKPTARPCKRPGRTSRTRLNSSAAIRTTTTRSFTFSGAHEDTSDYATEHDTDAEDGVVDCSGTRARSAPTERGWRSVGDGAEYSIENSAEQPSRRQTALKAGKSILEQIGSPDHNGWMRKNGE
ncbi:hypothetical protein FA95DRAFT_1613554 [Auriscalpium vulgare]|uniref:Uncharacterized protein n=1 Tax=Auriscalpium vulgare TaxID=40419 RepID=A0ACB8R3K8_9AGAM|nr:hypothetical protein FA95DRAFT_1613554 [Auriscalpium vulgare]